MSLESSQRPWEAASIARVYSFTSKYSTAAEVFGEIIPELGGILSPERDVCIHVCDGNAYRLPFPNAFEFMSAEIYAEMKFLTPGWPIFFRGYRDTASRGAGRRPRLPCARHARRADGSGVSL